MQHNKYDFAEEACATVADFVDVEGDDLFTAEEAVKNCVPGSTYYLVDEGAVFTAPDYGLGSYTYGGRTIVFVPFDSDYHRGGALSS